MKVQNVLPILWLLSSITIFVIFQCFIKVLAQDISIQYIVCMRSVLLLALNSYFIHTSNQYKPYESTTITNHKKYFSINIKNRKHFILMLKRIFWNSLSVNPFLFSLKFVNLSIANALFNTTPVLSFFVEAAYYKKSIKPISLAITIVCFIGIIIILNPVSSLDKEHLSWFLLLPLLSAFSLSLSSIYLHQMRSQFKQIVILEYAYITQLFTSGISIMLFGILESGNQQLASTSDIFMSFRFYFLLTIIVILSYGAHYLRIKALFKRKPSQILAYSYFGIILSIIFDMFFFNSDLQLMTIIGILLTGSGLLSQFILNLFGKQIQER